MPVEIATLREAMLDYGQRDLALEFGAVAGGDCPLLVGGDGNAEVARLVLTLSPVLTDNDLAAIADAVVVKARQILRKYEAGEYAER